MPNTESSKKRLRQDAVRRDRNRAAKSVLRKQVRMVGESVAAGDIEKAEAQYRVAAKHLDRAGAKNLIHRNAAARKKSRMQKLISAAKKA